MQHRHQYVTYQGKKRMPIHYSQRPGVPPVLPYRGKAAAEERALDEVCLDKGGGGGVSSVQIDTHQDLAIGYDEGGYNNFLWYALIQNGPITDPITSPRTPRRLYVLAHLGNGSASPISATVRITGLDTSERAVVVDTPIVYPGGGGYPPTTLNAISRIDGVEIINFSGPTPASATGKLHCIARADLVNNDGFRLEDGQYGPSYWKFEYAVDGSYVPPDAETIVISLAAKAATGYFDCWNIFDWEGGMNWVLQNNDNFVLSDGVNPAKTFEFKIDGSFVPVPGRITLDLSGIDPWGEDPIGDFGLIVQNGINAALNLDVTATYSGMGQVQLVNDAVGYAGNVTIINNTSESPWGGQALYITGMNGGQSEAVTAEEVAESTKMVINQTAAFGMWITATRSGVDVNLTNTGDPLHPGGSGDGNHAITKHVVNPGFTVTGMSGGEGVFLSLGGTSEVGLLGPQNHTPSSWEVTQLIYQNVIQPLPPFDPIYGVIDLSGYYFPNRTFKFYYRYTLNLA